MGTLTSKHVNLLPVVFFQFHVEERWGIDVQTGLEINTNIDK